MIYRLVVRPEAERDFAEAFDWYETQKPGLGTEFINAVEDAISTIQISPLAFAVVHRNLRRILLRKFPYCIYFVFADPMVSIVACFHAKRAPSEWKTHRP